MKRYMCAVALGLLATLGGCLEADEGDIRKGVVDYLRDAKFCVDLGLRKEDKRFWVNLEKDDGERARVLQAERLIEIGPKEKSSIMYKEWAWITILDSLKPFLDPYDRTCFGGGELVSLEEYTTPGTDVQGRRVTTVTFVYRIVNLPEWAHRSSLRKAFPKLDETHSSGLKDEIKLVHTNRGWRFTPY